MLDTLTTEDAKSGFSPTVEIHIKGHHQSGKTLTSDLIGKALQEAGFTHIKLVSQDNDFANRHGVEIQPLHFSHVNKDAIKFVIVDNNETPTLVQTQSNNDQAKTTMIDKQIMIQKKVTTIMETIPDASLKDKVKAMKKL